ncbi:MAG TPA: fused MFS/spermidine synthase [Planctomycetota bacterium]|nr:fused MFS/spermidine synthase [Planctomycetota bacterium]
MALAAVTLFIASALLFMVQPMTARHVLPTLGGTPAVWTTCMLFFQVTLLAGYAYSHRAPGFFGSRHRGFHLAIVALGLLPLCFSIPPFRTALDGESAACGLLLMLATTVGLPCFVLATTAPLVQRWYAASGRTGARDPYFLYAASNAGSLVGLLAYPLLVEPLLPLGQQRVMWTAGYALVVVATAACALVRGREAEPVAPATPVPAKQKLLWVLLAFAPSSLLLGVTTHLTTNLAPVPLLWAIPLALYLVTFVIAFSRSRTANAPQPRPMLPQWLPSFLRWTESPHPVSAVLPAVLLPLAGLFFWEKAEQEYGPPMILLHLLAFFLVALACHGRLAEGRPEPGRLTEYYLCIALGGALGGVFNGLVAPLVFPALIEYPLLIAVACFLLPGPSRSRTDIAVGVSIGALAATLLATRLSAEQPAQNLRLLVLGPPVVLALLVADRHARLGIAVGSILLVGGLFNDRGVSVIHRDRSIFGAHHVERFTGLGWDVSYLVNGSILHGAQNHDDVWRREPLTYYHRAGPCGELFAAMAGRIPGGRVAAVGLGVGSIAAYGAPGEHWTFFEIDTAVERTARSHFTFLSDSAASVDVQIGDGRLLLERARDGEFGLILLDAFNSDAIPVHLLTREALAIYLSKLAPGGVLAFHVSGRYVDLPPVVLDLAADAGLVALFKQEPELSREALHAAKCESKWVVMARSAQDLAVLAWGDGAPRPGKCVWTDDHSSLLSVLKIFR